MICHRCGNVIGTCEDHTSVPRVGDFHVNCYKDWSDEQTKKFIRESHLDPGENFGDC